MICYFLASNELVFINFYADWCRFSNLLQPIFDEAADMVISSSSFVCTYVCKNDNVLFKKHVFLSFRHDEIVLCLF